MFRVALSRIKPLALRLRGGVPFTTKKIFCGGERSPEKGVSIKTTIPVTLFTEKTCKCLTFL